jgi:hypothetical protein
MLNHIAGSVVSWIDTYPIAEVGSYMKRTGRMTFKQPLIKFQGNQGFRVKFHGQIADLSCRPCSQAVMILKSFNIRAAIQVRGFLF